MKKILFIGTGGTIASEINGEALSPALNAKQLLSHIPQISDFCLVDAVQLFTLDSTNITSWHWQQIAKEISKNYDKYDGFVIAHGTDTLAYTASALSYLIQNSKKPIVITGAQKPIGFDTTDSKQNLIDSFICASSSLCGVLVVFGGNVLIGSRARKVRSKSFEAFSSPNYPPIASVLNNSLRIYFSPVVEDTVFFQKLDSSVCIIKLTPGMDEGFFEYAVNNHKAVVIESFGVGGLPAYGSFKKIATNASESGKIIVMTTQVQREGTDLSVYEVGESLEKYGILEAFDMTPEACVTKLMWILTQTNNLQAATKLFYKQIFYDIIPQNEIETGYIDK